MSSCINLSISNLKKMQMFFRHYLQLLTGIKFYNVMTTKVSKQFILPNNMTPPSVSDISLFIYKQLLEGKPVCNLLSIFGIIKKFF